MMTAQLKPKVLGPVVFRKDRREDKLVPICVVGDLPNVEDSPYVQGLNGKLTPKVAYHTKYRCCPHCYGQLATVQEESSDPFQSNFSRASRASLEECLDCCSVWSVGSTERMNDYLFTYTFVETSERYELTRVAARIAIRRAANMKEDDQC